MISNKNKSRLYALTVFTIVFSAFAYMIYIEQKTETDHEILASVSYEIDTNYNNCSKIYTDLIGIWDENDHESDWDILMKLRDYLKLNSISIFIEDELIESQKRIEKSLHDEIRELNYKNKPIYDVFKKYSFLQKEYCLSVINYMSKTRNEYSEAVNDVESRYYEARWDVSDIVDGFQY